MAFTSRRFEVTSPQQSIGGVWWRTLPVAAALVSEGDDLGSSELSLIPDKVNIKEGDWVTIDAEKKLIKADTPTRIAWPVYTDGTRFDVRAGGNVTVVYGLHTAKTAGIKAGVAFVKGDRLTTRLGVLDKAASGEAIVAVAESNLLPGTDAFPDGFLEYSSLVNSVEP